MTIRAVAGAALAPEYDRFLFASIGVDRNGMQVSVLSGLAQSDLDPWQEAGRLAALPGKSAIERLTNLIETLPGKASGSEARTVATRLIALLPAALADQPAPGASPVGIDAMMKSRSWWVYVALMAFVLGSQWLIAIHPPPPASNKDDVQSSREVAPPVNFGQ